MTDESKPFYITTTLPYVNAKPHMGHALEFVRADIIARYKALTGHDVFFNTGTDEHGIKIYRKALDDDVEPQEYVDRFASQFQELTKKLNMATDVDGITFSFVRTTDPQHIESAQAFWRACAEKGFIYKKNYSVKYCVGCELEKTDSELNDDSRCPDHPNQEIELIEEENYFFKFSEFAGNLKKLYREQPDFVVPSSRLNEMKAFVVQGLHDFSISRLKEKMPWGVPVPNDDEHVMYVWFDALVNYISVIGWPNDQEMFEKWWPAVQYCGKDNTRQQSAMWQAMLMSVGLEPSEKVVVNGFVTSGGQKMSKSTGNVIDPLEIVDKYGAETLRYFVARELSPFEDSDVTMDRVHEAYTAHLVNGLGNLISRVMKMAEDNIEPLAVEHYGYKFTGYLEEKYNEFRLDLVTDYIWDKIGELDREIQEKKPWESKDEELIKNLALNLYQIGEMLQPILPETSVKIIQAVRENKKPAEQLFPRIDQ